MKLKYGLQDDDNHTIPLMTTGLTYSRSLKGMGASADSSEFEDLTCKPGNNEISWV